MEPDERQADYQNLAERRNILIHRRRLLERQRDILGVETPASVLLQIVDTNREIEIIEGKIRYLDIDPRTVELAGDIGVWAALTTRIERLERDFRSGLASVFEEIAADRGEARARDEQRARERQQGQDRTRWWLILLTFGQVLGLVLIASVLLTLLSIAHTALIAGR